MLQFEEKELNGMDKATYPQRTSNPSGSEARILSPVLICWISRGISSANLSKEKHLTPYTKRSHSQLAPNISTII